MRRLQDLGYDTYDAFMGQAIAEELDARCSATDTQLPSVIQTLRSIGPRWGTISQCCAEIGKAYRAIRTTPVNLQIQAGKLNDAGKPLGVIATNFSILSDEMAAMTAAVSRHAVDAQNATYAVVFSLCAESIQGEIQKELEAGNVFGSEEKRQADTVLLSQHSEQFAKATAAALKKMSRHLLDFKSLNARVEGISTGLSTTRVMCQIEAAKIQGGTEKLANVLHELLKFQSTTEECLQTIMNEMSEAGRGLAHARKNQTPSRGLKATQARLLKEPSLDPVPAHP